MIRQTLKLSFSSLAFFLWCMTAYGQTTVPAPGRNCVFHVSNDGSVEQWWCEADQGQPITVRYVWLNATEVSFMLTGYADTSIEGILGKKPIVAKNDVLRTLENLYARYGSRVTDQAQNLISREVVTGISPDGSNSFSRIFELKDMPTSIRQRFRLPTFEETIVWPEIDFMSQITQGKWPTNFNYEYDFTHSESADTKNGFLRQLSTAAAKNQKALSTLISECMQFQRPMTKAEWDNYGPTVDKLAEALLDKVTAPWQIASTYLDGNSESDLISDMADSEAYGFFSHITSDGIPDGFMSIHGTIGAGSSDWGCTGTAGGLNFAVLTPSLRVLVAVVAPTSKDVVVYRGSVFADKTVPLRAQPRFDANPSTMEFGNAWLSKSDGSSLIVPLQMGFTHAEDPFWVVPEIPISKEVAEIFAKYPDRLSKFYRCEDSDEDSEARACNLFLTTKLGDMPKGTDVAEDEVTSDSANQGTAIEFTYGAAYQIDSLTVDGQDVFVRDAPTAALVASASSEEGSCPFVYFELADGSIVRVGRILIGASSIDRMMIETVPVPQGAKRLIIRELEPEVTYLSQVKFDTGPESLMTNVAAQFVVLPPQTSFSLPIPRNASAVKIEGYYNLLTKAERENSGN
ncbi:hypothetical protein [Mesorhizobium sp. YR577]|uniref:hypothetical protein n=1 Tax=Mesorhizobium sp. YR577 TaxID=1884373 RepID=UPI0008EA6994|nr:hypothetical protein [Mesorhizobium sp. YR577]SFU23388.1 hypothetical protein SAMN05518861_1603 [Mesorhizobium sp. YR577]